MACCVGGPVPAPRRAHRRARRRAGRDLLATPLADPFAEEVVVVPAKGVERWLSQRLAHRLGRGARRRVTGSARACGSPRRGRWWPRCSGSPTTTRGPRTRWPGRCWRCSTTPSTRRGARRWPGTSATSTPAPRPSCGRGAGTPSPRGWPASSRRTPSSGRRCWPTGSKAGPPTAAAATSTTTWPGSPSCGGGSSAGSTRRRRTSGTRTPWPGSGTSRRRSTCPTGCPCSATPGCRSPRSSCSPRWPRAAPYTSGCRTPAARSGNGSPRPRRRCGRPRRRRQPSRGRSPAAGHPRAATAASCSGPWPRCRPTTTTLRSPAAPDTLLGWLQDDLRGNTVAAAGRQRAADDRSVQVHACHGAARQVDVLREVLLGMLEADPTLEPRDILVMCPDIETYAPLISAPASASVTWSRRRPPGASAAGPARRPVARPDEPAARRRRAAPRPRRQPGHGSQVLDLAAGRAGPPPLRVHRRRPRHDHHLGPRIRRALGVRPATTATRSGWPATRRTPGAPASTGCSQAW